MTDATSPEDDNLPAGLSLDSFAQEDWSAHRSALDEWSSGNIVTDVPLGWSTPAGDDPFTGATGTGQVEIAGIQDSVDAVIVSQTCDIGATKAGARHPFVMGAPLISESAIHNARDRADASKNKVAHLRPVPRGDLPDDAEPQYADLRFLMPISKGLLLERTPVMGLDGDDAVSLSETLAQKFRRPAAHDAISEKLPAALEKFIKVNKAKPYMAMTEQIRVCILEGTRLRPTTVQLLILTLVELSDEEKSAWRRVHEHVAQALSPDIKARDPIVIAAARADAVTYRESLPIRLDAFGPTRWM